MYYTQEIINTIEQKFLEGKCITEIHKELGLNRDSISKHLKKLGYNTVHNPIYQNIFEKIDNEEKAYWLGFLYADGYISKNNQIEVSLQLSDINHLQKLKKFLNTNTKISIDDHRCRLLFCSKKISNDLAKLGCINNKSLILTFPTKEQVSDEFLLPFIRGYIDGDGCISYIPPRITLAITSTKEFLEGMIDRANWDKNLISYYSSGKAFTLRTKKALTKIILHSLYDNCNIYLDRKYEKFLISLADLDK